MPLRFGFAVGILALLIGLPQAQSEWTWQSPTPQGNELRGLIWTGSQLVALGDHGTLLTSPDGYLWARYPACGKPSGMDPYSSRSGIRAGSSPPRTVAPGRDAPPGPIPFPLSLPPAP